VRRPVLRTLETPDKTSAECAGCGRARQSSYRARRTGFGGPINATSVPRGSTGAARRVAAGLSGDQLGAYKTPNPRRGKSGQSPIQCSTARRGCVGARILRCAKLARRSTVDLHRRAKEALLHLQHPWRGRARDANPAARSDFRLESNASREQGDSAGPSACRPNSFSGRLQKRAGQL